MFGVDMLTLKLLTVVPGLKNTHQSQNLWFHAQSQHNILEPMTEWPAHGHLQRVNLESVLKSRDITLPRKVCIVKAMMFPVVVYECESWTIKRLSVEELMLLNCGVGEDS